jgi:hypothetical protein
MNPSELALHPEATAAERQIAAAGEVIVMVVSEETETPPSVEAEALTEAATETLPLEPTTIDQPDLIAFLETQALEQAAADLALINPAPIVILHSNHRPSNQPRPTREAASRAEQLELEIQTQ